MMPYCKEKQRSEGEAFSRSHEELWREDTPDQDLVLQVPDLHKSFETSHADMGISGDGQGIAQGACRSQLCTDPGCGHQVPESQGLGSAPCDQALLIRKQLTGEDTVVRVLQEQSTLLCHLVALATGALSWFPSHA